MKFDSVRFSLVLIVVSVLALAGCGGGVSSQAKYPTGADRNTVQDANDIYSKPDSIFGGKSGSALFGRKEDNDAGAVGIGVNSFLWRASLDTVSFMPLTSADPFGGVILTDWYSAPETPNERIKLNVFILDRQLRSDGIQVKVFRQTLEKNTWRDAPVADGTGRSIEDAILTRAREMRVAQMGN